MKKKILGGIFILIVVIFAAFNVNINLKQQKSHLSLLNSANIEALAETTEEGESSSNKNECNQLIEYKLDPLNGTQCRDRDYYTTYRMSITSYTCGKGFGSSCKKGNLRKGNDCNNSYDDNISSLKVKSCS